MKYLNNEYQLIHVEAQERLHMADIILQFKRKRKAELGITAEVDVKATAEDFKDSGKSPNITSFQRIRTAYVEDPDYIFIILSLKHRALLKTQRRVGAHGWDYGGRGPQCLRFEVSVVRRSNI